MTPEMTPVDSSSIRSVGYDETARTLFIEFLDGGTYAYDEVPPHVYDELVQAESVGGYFNRTIRTTYVYRQT